MASQRELKGMRVAVTGAAGFIGSNLVDYLVDRGCSVIGVDNFSTGSVERGESGRFVNGVDYAFEMLDVNDSKLMRQIFWGCDVVFHMAALARVSFSTEHPLEANFANINGTLSVLEAARQAKVGRVIFSCSSSIFGGVGVFPTKEDSRPCPLSLYALQKLAGAEYCRLYSELYGLDTINLLYYNVFGPHQHAGSAYSTVIPAFFKAALAGEPCKIYGDGEQRRDFCFISNVVDALLLAAESQRQFKGEMINIACGEHHSVNDVFERVVWSVRGVGARDYYPPRPGDPLKSHADITRAKELLGYEPRVLFDEGLERTAQWWLNGKPSDWWRP